MSGKDSDKDTKKGKKDEPTKQSWKKKVEDLPGGAKDKAVKGGGGPNPRPPDADPKDGIKRQLN